MSTYHPHTNVTFGGTLNTTVPDREIWQCGVRVMKPGAAGPLDDHDAYLAVVAPRVATWFGGGATDAIFPTSATLDWIKANPIGADGSYSDTTTHVHDFTPPQAGGMSGSPEYPDIICIVLSWKTAKAVRKHSYATHGRIYPPSYSAIPGTVGAMRIPTVNAAAWAGRGVDLLNALASSSVPCVPIVASGHGGEYQPITGVRVGNVLDVQRRRKSALKEVYSELAYSSG